LSFSYTWLDKNKVHTFALPDYKNYKKDRRDDSALCRDLWELMASADIIVAHNGDQFDLKTSNARFVINGLTPAPSFKSFDTLKIARRHFRFSSNKLDNIARALKIGRKLHHTGKDLWVRCLNGEPAAWDTMRRYNAQDCRLLEAVYLRLRAFAPSHPNLNLYTNASACPTCQSADIKKRGLHYLKSTVRQRMRCNDCGAQWCSEIINQSPSSKRSAA
jgi:hypothetical protein